MEVVSQETAKKLKEAGFPQPTSYEDGQFYYDGNHLCICVCSEKRTLIDIGSIDGAWTARPCGIGIVPPYAPTATDIMLQSNCSIELQITKDKGFRALLSVFETKEKPEIDFCDLYHFFNPNPAEAAAAAWLKLNAQ